MSASNTTEDSDLKHLIEDSLQYRSLQARIPSNSVTFLANGEQAIFLAPPSNDANKNLSLRYLNLNGNKKGEYESLCDFSEIASLNTNLSHAQLLLRERQRESSHGITSYTYHKETDQLLFQYGPHLVTCRLPEKIESAQSVMCHKIGDSMLDDAGTRMYGQFTPDGQWIVFSRNDELFITHTDSKQSNTEFQLTFSQNVDSALTAGSSDFIMQEEFDRYTGFWICDQFVDKKDLNIREYKVLFLEADNRQVPTITIPSMDGVESHLWPRAGELNCKYRVKIACIHVPLKNGNNVSIEHYKLKQSIYLSFPWIEYVVRGGWTQRDQMNDEIWLQYLDRDQMKTNFVLYRLSEHFVKCEKEDRDGFDSVNENEMKSNENEKFNVGLAGDIMMELVGSPWINIHDTLKFIDKGLIIGLELSGFRHLYFIPYPPLNGKMVGKSLTLNLEKESKNEDIDMATKASENASKENNERKEEPFEDTLVNLELCLPLMDISNVVTLTQGKWAVERDQLWFDSKHSVIYFVGRRESHLERQLYRVTLNGKDNESRIVTRLSQAGFCHNIALDFHNFSNYATVNSSIVCKNRFQIFEIKSRDPPKKLDEKHGDNESVGFENLVSFELPSRGQPKYLQYSQPRLLKIKNMTAQKKAMEIDETKKQQENNNNNDKSKSNNSIRTSDLDYDANNDSEYLNTFSAVVFEPNGYNEKENKRYPTIIQVYGGPHAQLITNSWDSLTGHGRYQLWTTLGYCVAIIDGRGSDGRGLAFEGRLKYRMGQIEIDDQVCLVNYLSNELKICDPKRVTITGYSYGGYMSLMALCQRPDIFKIGISGAPVVHWELYDTGYTERYMGTPQKHGNGYENGRVTKYAKDFPNEENRVVVIHGLSDENVHMFHTSKLINEMIKQEKPYVLKIFPGERHGIRRYQNVMYMERFIIDHWKKYL